MAYFFGGILVLTKFEIAYLYLKMMAWKKYLKS
jgi:hypothetical protein